VVLALIAILALSLVKGIGLHSASRLARANEALQAPSVATGAPAAGKGGRRIAGAQRQSAEHANPNASSQALGN